MKYEEREVLELVKKAQTGSLEILIKSAETLQELSRSMLKDTVQAFTLDLSQELFQIKKENTQIQRTLASLPKTELESFYYASGVFTGAYGTVVELYEHAVAHEAWRGRLNLLKKKHIKDILVYLYHNPYARQKHIAESVKIQPNYLSELLHLLLDAELVERTGKNKSTQYYLLRSGRQMVREQILPNEAEKLIIDVDYKEFEKKEQFLEGKVKEAKETAKLAEKGETLYGTTKWKFNSGFGFKTALHR